MTAVITHAQGLQRELLLLREARLVPWPGDLNEGDLAAMTDALSAAVRVEIGAFAAPAKPTVAAELTRHAHDHIREVARLLRGGELGDFAFVSTHARQRAEQHFPLELTLHAYRIGHKVIARWIRQLMLTQAPRTLESAVALVADFSLEYTNAVSSICTADYVAHARLLAEAESDHRHELLKLLLEGHEEADGRVTRLLKRQGFLEQRQSFCVVLARSTDPLEMEFPGRAQRIIEAISQALSPLPIRSLIGVRRQLVTAICTGTRRLSGWTAPHARLIDRLSAPLQLLGPAVLVGVSGEHPSLATLPRALREASIALDIASVSERVVGFANVPLRRLLLHLGGDALQSMLPVWWGELHDANTKAQGALVNTLRAYADADLNVQEAARALGVHPNTIYSRLQRIAVITNLNGRRFHELAELLLLVDSRLS